MVKFDIDGFKFLQKEHFRVLTAIEMGMKNHDLVPTTLIETISQMKRGNCFKVISDLHKNKLVVHDSKPYDGYRLTFRGYDYLSIYTLVQRGLIIGVGRQIGVGKESDVFEVFSNNNNTDNNNNNNTNNNNNNNNNNTYNKNNKNNNNNNNNNNSIYPNEYNDGDNIINTTNNNYVLKLHRLGRISFRKVKEKRDYLGKRKSASWLYLSRLSALKEYAFMKLLSEKNFPVPMAIDVSRHGVLMTRISGFPLYHVTKIRKPAILYNKCMQLLVQLAEHGLVHCDFNEFNLLVDNSYNLTLIDFPQMISIHHPNAIDLFNHDVKCIREFFSRKHNYKCEFYPTIDETFLKKQVHTHLDTVVKASGFFTPQENEDYAKLIEEYQINLGIHKNDEHNSEEEDENEEDDDEDVDEEEDENEEENDDEDDEDDDNNEKEEEKETKQKQIEIGIGIDIDIEPTINENNTVVQQIIQKDTKKDDSITENENKINHDNNANDNDIKKNNNANANANEEEEEEENDDNEEVEEDEEDDEDEDDEDKEEDKKEEEDDDDNEKKLQWQRKKMEKRKAFEQRRKLKKQFALEKGKMMEEHSMNKTKKPMNSTSVENDPNDEEDVMDWEEIKRRVKKKEKQQLRRSQQKKAKKIGNKNKLGKHTQNDLKQNSFWG